MAAAVALVFDPEGAEPYLEELGIKDKVPKRVKAAPAVINVHDPKYKEILKARFGHGSNK